MSEVLYGQVVNVTTKNTGTVLLSAAPVGATTLQVEDASVFDETGGMVLLDDAAEPVYHIGADPGFDIVVLAAPLAVALEEGAEIQVYPEAPTKVAMVDLDGDGDAIDVTVPHNLKPLLEDGIRGDTDRETVELELRGYEWLLKDITGKPAMSLEDIAADTAEAVAKATDAEAAADGKATTFYGATEPTGASEGDLWLRDPDNLLHRFTDGAWVATQDQSIVEAIDRAQNAQDTADGKIVSFWQAAPPPLTQTAIVNGDTTTGWASTSFEEWKDGAWGTGGGALVTKDSSWSGAGNYSIKITPTGSTASSAYPGGPTAGQMERLGLVPGQTYTISATCRIATTHDGATSASRSVYINTNGAVPFFGSEQQAPTAPGEYRLKTTFTIPADATTCYFRLYNGSATVPVWWDDLQIEPGATSGALLDMPSVGDLWYNTAKGNKPHRWDGSTWTPLPAGQGALDLGVVANTIVDPSFKLGSRLPPAPYWSIDGPDAGTGENYLTCTTPTDTITRWSVAASIPCEEDRAVRVVAKIKQSGGVSGTARLSLNITLTNDTITYRTYDIDLASDVTTAWQTFEDTTVVPAGTESIELVLATLNQTAGSVSFMHPEMQVLWSRVQSADYVQGESGWALTDETTQVNNLQVLGDVGATSASVGTLTLDGQNLVTEILGPLPAGAVAFASAYSGSHAGNISSTERGPFAFNAGMLPGGRLYRTRFMGRLDQSGLPNVYQFKVTYTTDGSFPTSASPVLPGGAWRYRAHDVINSFDFETYFSFANIDTLRMNLYVVRTAGSGYGWIYVGDDTWKFQWLVEDLGARSAAGGTMAQRITGGGEVVDPAPPPPQPDPPSTYTKSWYATWTRSYDQNNSTRLGDDTPDMYQGRVSNTHGNTKSLAGFDYAAIQSALSGATIKSVKLTFKVKHAYWGAGARAVIRTHDYTSKPSTYDEGRVGTVFTDGSNLRKSGNTYTVTLSTAVGNNFKSGAARGIGFGPGVSTSLDYYAYMYGGTSSARPKLTIVYEK